MKEAGLADLSTLIDSVRQRLAKPARLYLVSRTSHLAESWCDRVPALELAALLGIFVLLWVFFSGVNYTRLQFNTGIRYLSATLPFLFVPAAITLMRLPRRVIYFIAIAAIAQAWCLAMYRDVEIGRFGVFDPVLQVFLGGFRLPFLTTLSRVILP